MTTASEMPSDAERRLEQALATVEPWNGARIRWAPAVVPVASPVHRGVSGACYKVHVEGHGEFFVKVAHSEVRCFFDVSAIADASAKAAALGVAPAFHFALPEQAVLAYELLPAPWREARVDDFADRDTLERVIAAKKRLHQGPRFTRTRSVLEIVDDVTRRARSSGTPLPPDYAWMLDNAGDIGDAIGAAAYDPAPCHGDGVASNVMIGPDGAVRLVDFDLAANEDPFRDLGSLFTEAFQFDDEARLALEIYCGHVDEKVLNRCRLYGILDDLYWGTWGLFVFHHSPRQAIEFFKYGQWRLLRCRMNMNDWRFEEWLRKI